MKFKNRLKISEIAQIAEINTRTLHYYDDIGLFSPERKDENGYRYYSLEQLVDLGIILSLKELDMPLKEIKSLLSSDVQTSRKILERKKKDVDKKIQNLTDIKQVIEQKIHFFELAEEQTMQIKFIELEEEYLILSEKIEEATSQNLIETAYDLLLNEGKYLFVNNEYGAMFHHQKRDTESYDFFFLKTSHDGNYNFVKPAGRYLRFIYKGNDQGLKNAYLQLKEYICDKHLSIDGYFYERALNETTNVNQEEYITEIQVKVV